MSALERAVQQVRPGLVLRALAVHDDEVVLTGGGEVFRLPLTSVAAARSAVLIRALPELRTRLPVAWGVPDPDVSAPDVSGGSSLLHGALDATALLVDPGRGLLTGVVGWRLRLGDPDEDLASLPEAVRAALD